MTEDKQLTSILEACSMSTKTTAKTFFPERFNMPFASAVHDKIFDLIDGPAQKVAIAAPRGWGSSRSNGSLDSVPSYRFHLLH